jgi:uncharacterized protein YegP (UPF0339 family)
MKFVIRKDARNQFYWLFKAANGEDIARSSESYVRKESCQHSIYLVKTGADKAPVSDET